MKKVVSSTLLFAFVLALPANAFAEVIISSTPCTPVDGDAGIERVGPTPDPNEGPVCGVRNLTLWELIQVEVKQKIAKLQRLIKQNLESFMDLFRKPAPQTLQPGTT